MSGTAYPDLQSRGCFLAAALDAFECAESEFETSAP
jgi:hypothetical protein